MILGHDFHHHHHNYKLNSRVPTPVTPQMTALTLEPIRADKVRHGAYIIRFHGTVPPHSEIRLLLGTNDRLWMDITKGYQKHRTTHLEQLLELMERGGFWSQRVPVRVAAYSGGMILSETLLPAKSIQCPLEPLRELGVEEIGAVEGLHYTGALDGSGGGTFLSSPIKGKYYFVYGGMFETDSKRRGFDCTTYVGSAYGLPNGQGMGGDGGTLAAKLGAESCDMEHKHPPIIKKFFEEHKSGAYIMWSHGHVVVVKDAVVHEFTDRINVEEGYQHTDVAEWLTLGKHKSQTFSVRKLRS